jgi:2-dehydropantoate 2-reductase
MDGAMSPRVRAIEAAFAPARGVVAKAVPDIAQRLWEKLVHLGTSAIGTVLMRAQVGEIVRAGGSAWLHRVLDRNAAIAAHHGHPMPEAFLAEYRALFADASSAYATSMLRDIEGGGRSEGEHILGFLHEAALLAGVPAEIHEAALLHARAHEARRIGRPASLRERPERARPPAQRRRAASTRRRSGVAPPRALAMSHFGIRVSACCVV